MQHGVALLVVIGNVPFLELARNFVNTIATIDAFLAAPNTRFENPVHRSRPRPMIFGAPAARKKRARNH
jgi:hypothetical protein